MSIPADLDAWAAGLEAATGLKTTRDPDLIVPPCLYVDLPEIITPTLTAVGVEIPVFLVAPGSGKQAGDLLLTWLPTVLDAIGVGQAQPQTLQMGQISWPAYKITVPAHLVPDPTPAEPDTPVAEAALAVDRYGGSFIRVMTNPLLDDAADHWVTFVLATTAGPGDEVIGHTNQIASDPGVAWFDHGGQLGHVTHAGTDLPNITLSNYIRQGRLAQVHIDTTDPAHPALVITDVYNPPAHA